MRYFSSIEREFFLLKPLDRRGYLLDTFLDMKKLSSALLLLVVSGIMVGCETTSNNDSLTQTMPVVTPTQNLTQINTQDVDLSRVHIGHQVFNVEIADTNKERQKGLMWRQEMPQDRGMLFVFSRAERHSFWMKNTLIPLDIIWISADKKVVDVHTLQPCPAETLRCPGTFPSAPAQYVLEVNAGAFNGNIGDTVEF